MRSLSSSTIGILLFLAQDSAGQSTESEVNHPCVLAQDLGSVALPHMITGALDPLLSAGDVDFYRIDVPPNDGIQIDLEGRDSGGGTLRDPFLGLFDSDCRLLRLDDDSGSLSSRVITFAPADGVLILAASSCCDPEFRGDPGVGGTYRMIIRSAALLQSIGGRAVDAITGDALDGTEFPFPRAELYMCVGVSCDQHLRSGSLSSDGRFLFGMDSDDEALFAGRYRVQISAQRYADAETLPFDVAEGEERDLGDIAVTPLARIGTISGQIVDAVTLAPLSGQDPPFARAELRRCEAGFCSFVDSMNVDDQGRYSFGDDPFRLFEPGLYKVEAEAEEYRPAETAALTVGEGEDVTMPLLPIEPFPIGFSEIRPCGDLPPQGGVCRFTARVVNRSTARIEGAAWSLVEAFTGTLAGNTEFQAGAPKILSVPPRGSRMVQFSFPVPANLGNGTTICSEIFFGSGRTGYLFNTVGRRDLFCIQKGLTVRVLDEKESRALRNKVESQRQRTRNRR
jgi:hypothetical protein